MEITIKFDIDKFDISTLDLNKLSGQISEVMKDNFNIKNYTLSINNANIGNEENIYID